MVHNDVIRNIEDMLGEKLRVFFSKVETEHKIPKGTIWTKWCNPEVEPKSSVITTTIPVQPPVDKTKEVKKSNYQVFFSIQRAQILKDDPSVSFGEVSRRVSAMWKQVSPEERAKYVCNDEEKRNSVQASVKKNKVVEIIIKDEPKTEMIFSKTQDKSRAKLEISVDDENNDEDDFYFQEGTDDDISESCDDSDDGDIFVDED